MSMYVKVARTYTDERNFKSAHKLVQKGMSLRPNDKELRELDEFIAENWKRRSAAKTSNAKPTVKSGP